MLLAIIPDWNSLDSVRRAHSDLELAGLVFFGLLVLAEAISHSSKDDGRKHLFDTIGIWVFAVAVLCELVAYPYGQRNDELSSNVIGSLDEKATKASEKATAALTDSGVALTQSGQALTNAGSAEDAARLANAAASQATYRLRGVSRFLDATVTAINPRLLRNEKAFNDVLAKIPKGTAEVWYEPNDPEAAAFSFEISAFLGLANWKYSEPCPLPESSGRIRDIFPSNEDSLIERLRYGANSTGLDVGARTDEGASILIQAIGRGSNGAVSSSAIDIDQSLSENHFVIVVGRHIPTLPLSIPNDSGNIPAHKQKNKKTKRTR